jgi:hypothetical protein
MQLEGNAVGWPMQLENGKDHVIQERSSMQLEGNAVGWPMQLENGKDHVVGLMRRIRKLLEMLLL